MKYKKIPDGNWLSDEDRLTMDDIKRYIQTIPLKWKIQQSLILYYGIRCKAKTNKEIAKEFNVCPHTVYSWKKSGLRKMSYYKRYKERDWRIK